MIHQLMLRMCSGEISRSLVLSFCMTVRATSAADVNIELVDPESSHVHPPGIPFTLEVMASAPELPGAKIYAQWVNAESSPVEQAIELPAEKSDKFSRFFKLE